MDRIIDLTSDDDGGKNAREPIRIAFEDEDDEELNIAIALSLQDQGVVKSSSGPQSSAIDKSTPSQVAGGGTSAKASGAFQGLDRTAMEAERLARLKRKREGDSTEMGRAPYATPAIESISPPPARTQKQESTRASTNVKPTVMAKPAPAILSSQPNHFPTPTVLLTATPSRTSSNNKLEAISFTDIIKPPPPTSPFYQSLTLKSALLSSFIIDFDWLLPHFDTFSIKFVFVLHAHNAKHRTLLQQDFAGLKKVRLLMPEVLGGGGNMHSKLMLLFFQSDEGEELCRIAVPSANLVPYDWGVGDIMENVVTVVDLPLKKTDSGQQAEKQFERELKKQLRAMGVSDEVLRKLGKYDFDATNNIGFVHSVSGSKVLGRAKDEHIEDAQKQQGMKRFLQASKLAKAPFELPLQSEKQELDAQDDPAHTGVLSLLDTVASLGLSISPKDPAYPPRVDFITSSLGNLTIPFIRQLYLAICGRLDPSSIARKITSATKRFNNVSGPGNIAENEAQLDQVIKQNLKIYFPTSETVHRSKGGTDAAGTICFQKKWWETNELIRHCLHDCVGVRGDGILTHSKILFVRFQSPKVVEVDTGEAVPHTGWAYIGSANLSESAWGRVVGDTKSGLPKMTNRNWESGVVIPVRQDQLLSNLCSGDDLNDRDVHRVTMETGGSLTKDVSSESHASSARNKFIGFQGQKGKGPKKSELIQEGTIPRAGRSEAGAAISVDRPGQGSSGALAVPHRQHGSLLVGACTLEEVFSSILPVPVKYPSCRHEELRQEPWFFKD